MGGNALCATTTKQTFKTNDRSRYPSEGIRRFEAIVGQPIHQEICRNAHLLPGIQYQVVCSNCMY